MALLDRYLLAVRLFLPRAQQKDIIRELSEDIRSGIEDKEGSLGRPLTEAEQEEVIKQFGHPALLAGRYGPPQHLIGPEIFPIYRFVLKLAIPLAAGIHIVIATVLLATGRPVQALRQAALILPAVAFLQFGLITLVFAAAERHRSQFRLLDRWSPREFRAEADAKRVTNSFAGLVAGVVFALWWVAVGRFPSLIIGPGAEVFKLAPAWKSVYLWILLLALAGTVKSSIDLLRPQWTRLRVAMALVLTGGGVTVMLFLQKAGDFVVRADASQRVAGYDRVMTIINDSMFWVLAFAIAISVLVMVLEVRRIVRGDHQQLRKVL
jgi:hypothetical protein